MSQLAFEQPNFQLLFEFAPGLQFVVEPEAPYTLIAINQPLLKILNLTRQQALGAAAISVFATLVSDSGNYFYDELNKSLDHVVASSKTITVRFDKYSSKHPAATADQKELFWSLIHTPIFDQQGHLMYVLNQIIEKTEFVDTLESSNRSSFDSEITESELLLRKQQLEIANQQLRTNEEYLRQLFENSLDAVIGMDTDGKITHWNVQAEAIFGWKKIEVQGVKMSEVIIPHRYREAHERGLKHYLNTGNGPILNKRLELQALTKAQTEIQVELSITAVRTRDHFAFYGVLRDISERTKYIEELKNAKAAAEAASMAMSTFLVQISREIRTPLNAVLGFSELVTEENLNEEEKTRFVKALRRSGELLSNIVKDILEFSKCEDSSLSVTADLNSSRPPYDFNLEISANSSTGADNLSSDSPSETPKLKDIDILLVDDSPDNLTLVTYLLEIAGARVETAENGQIAYEKAYSKKYDVILMELQMPVMDGYETTQKLRQGGYTSTIIALTARASAKDRELCLARGFNEHIAKPIHRQKLIDDILRVYQLVVTN